MKLNITSVGIYEPLICVYFQMYEPKKHLISKKIKLHLNVIHKPTPTEKNVRASSCSSSFKYNIGLLKLFVFCFDINYSCFIVN